MPELNREEITKLEALYASNPEGRVFTHLAEAYRKAGEYDRARSILEQGLEKHPAYASAHVVLGRVFTDLNDIPQARASFRHVLELDPHNLVALRSLGELARSAGSHAEALGYFEELRHQDPGNDDIDRIIEELKQPPADVPAATEARVEVEETPAFEVAREEHPQVQGSFEEPQFEREPTPPEVLEELPGFESVQPDYGDLVSSDLDLGWTAGGSESESDAALPGDLADFVEYAAEAPGEAAPESLDVSDLQSAEEEVTYETIESVDLPEAEPPIWAQIEEPASEELLAQLPEPDLAPDESAKPEPAVFEAELEFEETELEIVQVEADSDSAPESWAEPEPQPESEPQLESEILSEAESDIEAADLPVWAEPVTAAAEEAEDSPPDDLVTETMAELLVGQGLHDAAADVYRALIRERPWDPDLKRRLDEVETAARSGGAPEAEPEPAEVEPESPWTSAPAATAGAATPYAWTEDTSGEGEETGPPIAAYFRSLLTWRPGAAAPEPAPSEEPIPEPALEPEPEPEMANFDATPAHADQPAMLELDTPAEATEAAEQLMPWEVAEPPAQVMTPAPPAARQSDNPVEAAFEEWFNASPESEPARASSSTEEGDEDSDDDDLEMFRSWLQSLKK